MDRARLGPRILDNEVYLRWKHLRSKTLSSEANWNFEKMLESCPVRTQELERWILDNV